MGVNVRHCSILATVQCDSFVPKDGRILHPERLPTHYAMTFHPLSLADIRALGTNSPDEDLCFATVVRLSDVNHRI